MQSWKEQQSLIKKPFKFKLKQAFTPRTSDSSSGIRETSITSTETKLQSMAALQRFKHLATQCGVAPSPTRSPRTSPLVHLRRRRTTLRSILLGRRVSGGIRVPPRERDEEKSLVVKRSSLKDLFVSSSSSSSPPLELRGREQKTRVAGEKSAKEEEASRAGSGTPRPGWSGFRYRSLLLRRAWRPVLVTIPE